MRRLNLTYFPFDPVLLGVDGIDGISHDGGDGFRVESGYYVLDEAIVSLVGIEKSMKRVARKQKILHGKNKYPYDSVLRGALTFTLTPRHGLLRSLVNVIKILQDDKNFINLHV